MKQIDFTIYKIYIGTPNGLDFTVGPRRKRGMAVDDPATAFIKRYGIALQWQRVHQISS